jgi:hypothetical protein
MPAGIWIFHDPGCALITGNRIARQLLGELEGGGTPENERPWKEIRKGGVPISPDQLLMHTACATGQEVNGEAIEIIRSRRCHATALWQRCAAVRQ